jgi:hypothetical protein
MSNGCGGLRRLRNRHRQWIHPDAYSLNPSSSTETESGNFDEELPTDTALDDDRDISLRSSASWDKVWMEPEYVPADYSTKIRRRSLRDQILESIKNRRIEPALSKVIHLPVVAPPVWSRLDERFGQCWISVPCVMIAWIVRLLLLVFLLFLSTTSSGRHVGTHAQRIKLRMEQYIR